MRGLTPFISWFGRLRRTKRGGFAPKAANAPASAASASPAADRLTPWSLSQRCALLVIFSGVCLLLIIRCVLNPRYVSDPPGDPPSRADELADRIDPNTCDWNDLAAIPNVGENRARAIIAYRDSRQGTSKGPVFRSADDLMAVRGIGYSMATKLKPYLVFPTPATSPATRP